MAKLIMIAAIGKNRELGVDNHLIWHLSEDLKYFKQKTLGHKIVMGYKTFASFKKILPNREHLVLTHNNIQMDNVKVFANYESLLEYLKTLEEDIYIIGGATIYRLFIQEAEELLLTEVDATFGDADTYFPEFSKEDFDKELIDENMENDINYRFVRYRKKNKKSS